MDRPSGSRAPRLIHLNGPPGVGKSTLAHAYATDHPGTLNLDIDVVASLIGGWHDDFFGVLPSARRIAIAMAQTHLSAGSDVVMPQLVTDLGEAARFSTAAEHAGADYVEVALLVEPAEQFTRFRAKATHSEVNTLVDSVVTAEGGTDFLARVQGHLDAYLDQRANALRLCTSGADAAKTYVRLRALLDG